MTNQILALKQFGLTIGTLRRLGQCRVRIRVYLRSFEVTPRISALAPADRHPYLRRQASRWVTSLRERYPDTDWRIDDGARGISAWLEGSVPSAEVPRIATEPGVRSVVLLAVPGRRRQRTERSKPWFCVRARVVIQVEGEERGLQTVEDRFMLVRATSAEDAVRRLLPQWREYAKPYLTSNGQLVRWKFEEVTDIYEAVLENDENLDMAEVYSQLRGRRMRPEFVWRGDLKKRKIVRRSGRQKNGAPELQNLTGDKRG
jgi:hypothetical protein